MSWSRIMDPESVKEWRGIVKENEEIEQKKINYFGRELKDGTKEYDEFMEGDY